MSIFKQLSPRVGIGIVLLAFLLTPFSQGGRDPISIVVITVAVAALAYVWLTGTKRRVSALPVWLWLAFGGFVLFQIVSLIWTQDRFNGIVDAITIVQVAFVFLISLTFLRKQQIRDRIISLVGVGAFVILLTGFAYYLIAPLDKSTSLLLWAAPYSLYLGFIILLAMYRLSQKPSRFWVLIAVLSVASLILTQNPITIILVVILLGVVWWFSNKPKELVNSLKGVGATIVLAAVLALALLGLRNTIFENNALYELGGLEVASSLETTNPTDIVEHWRGALKLWFDNPVVGHGIGSFEVRYPEFQTSPEASIPDAHNAYLHLAGEAGIVGLLFLAVIFFFVLQRWLSGPKDGEQLTIGAIALLLSTHMFFFPSISFPTLHFWLAFTFAYLIVVTRPRAATNRIDAKWASVIVVVSFALIVPSVAIFRSRQFGQAGLDAYAAQDIAKAQTSFQKANKQLISDPDYLTQEALQLWFAGDVEAAKAKVEEAIKRDPHDATHYDLRAYFNNRLGERDKAIEDYNRAIKMDPFSNPDIYTEYSGLLIDVGRIDQAKALLDSILTRYQGDFIQRRAKLDFLNRRVARLHFERAQIAYFEGDLETAREQTEKTLELFPEYESAQKLLDFLNQPAPTAV